MKASSFVKGHEPEFACDENVQTWWKAAAFDAGEWLETDLGEGRIVYAVQLNFADELL